MESCPHCAKKHTPRSNEEIKSLKNRLNKINGQINGIIKMIEENRYCSDVLVQIAAAKKALENVGFEVLSNHLSTCVSDDIKNNDFASLEEAVTLIKKLK